MPEYWVLSFAVLIMYYASQGRSDTSDHRYKAGDPVPLYVNKVGPYRNPSETYAYFDLPFCSPDPVKEKRLSLGEALNGDRLASALYKVEFLVEKVSQVLCRRKLTREEVSVFRSVIAKDYYYEMYFDELPIWGFIGQAEQQRGTDTNKFRYFIMNNIQFEIHYNEDRVIKVSILSLMKDNVDITENMEVDIEFIYSVVWKKTNSTFEKRMDTYKLSSLLSYHLKIHRSSITNSFATVLVLIGCLVMFYVLVLKKDISKYSNDNELGDNQEETGWKYIHGDVFRYPKHKSLFAAALGSGTHLLTLTVLIIILGIVGLFYPYNRGLFMTAVVIIYALTSWVAGYVAVSFYYQLEGTNWVWNLLLNGGLFCGPLFVTFFSLNTVANAYRATAALPLAKIVIIFLIWAILASPLLFLGGIYGKYSKFEFQAPCRTNNIPREIPPLHWCRGIIPQMVLAGILPFSVMYLELYYIFASAWGFRVYTIYSILFVVFTVLLVVTALVSVALTYFQLAAEDHQWWWRSFLSGGSTGLYMYGYCVYYYFTQSAMDGLMQTSFFFGYMGCICYGVFLMLGTVGFRASLLFVRYLYGSIKCE
ncbi:hypothetical protein LguiA_000763 [Lonicera macranthoides]